MSEFQSYCSFNEGALPVDMMEGAKTRQRLGLVFFAVVGIALVYSSMIPNLAIASHQTDHPYFQMGSIYVKASGSGQGCYVYGWTLVGNFAGMYKPGGGYHTTVTFAALFTLNAPGWFDQAQAWFWRDGYSPRNYDTSYNKYRSTTGYWSGTMELVIDGVQPNVEYKFHLRGAGWDWGIEHCNLTRDALFKFTPP